MDVPRIRMRVAEARPHMVEELRSFRLEGIPPNPRRPFSFLPGQFVQIHGHTGQSAYFAIASSPDEEEYLELLVKRGDGLSRALFERGVGYEVEVVGPHGPGFPIDRFPGHNLLMIGVGTGIAPLRSTLRTALRRRDEFGQLTFIYGVLTPKHFCYLEDLHDWSRRQVQIHLTVTFPEGTSWVGHSGFVQDVLRTIKPAPENTVAMLVGMKDMIRENTGLLLELGFPTEKILLNF